VRFRMLWIKHLALEIKTLQPRGDAGEIAGGAVAGGASAGAFEVFLTGSDLPGLQGDSVDALASAFSGVRALLLRVNKGHESSNLRLGYVEWWLPGLGKPVRDHWTDLISIYILADKSGAGKVGPGFSAAGIAAMTEGPILAEEVGSLLDDIGIVALGGRPSLVRCGRVCRPHLSESKLQARVRRGGIYYNVIHLPGTLTWNTKI